MLGLFKLILGLVRDLFRSRATLETEILVLRQIIVLRRGRVGRLPFYQWRTRHYPAETVMRWHRTASDSS
jgi:hypothetical protein